MIKEGAQVRQQYEQAKQQWSKGQGNHPYHHGKWQLHPKDKGSNQLEYSGPDEHAHHEDHSVEQQTDDKATRSDFVGKQHHTLTKRHRYTRKNEYQQGQQSSIGTQLNCSKDIWVEPQCPSYKSEEGLYEVPECACIYRIHRDPFTIATCYRPRIRLLALRVLCSCSQTSQRTRRRRRLYSALRPGYFFHSLI